MEEQDRFTRLMFGDRGKDTDALNKEDDYHEEGKDEDNSSRDNDWLFGRKRDHRPLSFFGNRKQEHRQQEKYPLENLLQNLDYGKLMNHVDGFMNSAKELKPLVNQIKPYLKSFTQKK